MSSVKDLLLDTAGLQKDANQFREGLRLCIEYLEKNPDIGVIPKIQVLLKLSEFEFRLGTVNSGTSDRLMLCFTELNKVTTNNSQEEQGIRLSLFDAMGGAWLRQFRIIEAEQALLYAYEGKKKLFGELHLSTIATMANLANAHFRNRKFDVTINLCAHFLELHPLPTLQEKLQNRLLFMDATCILLKTYAEALKMINAGNAPRVKEIYTALLAFMTEETPEKLCILHEYSIFLYQYTEDKHLGLTMLQDCYGRKRDVLGVDHFDTLSSYHHIGRAYMECGEIMNAKTTFTLCLERRRQLLGDQDDSTLNTIFYLAECLDKLEEYEQSELLWKECLVSRQYLYNIQRLMINELLATFDKISNHFYIRNMFPEALDYAQQSYDLSTKILGIDHIITQYIQKQLDKKYKNYTRIG
jgi:tetratricopeptide (TPR) repeat protein